MKYTKEQEYIIDLFNRSNNVAVNAFAGTGKSSTQFAVIKENPDKNFLIIVFSKSLQLEAEKKIKELKLKNATARTIHGLAYGPIVMANKYKVRNNQYKPYEIAEKYKIQLNSAFLVSKVLDSYWNSDDASYTILINKYKHIDKKVSTSVIKIANQILKDIRNNKLDITHQAYLKEFHLKVVNENYSFKKYDCLINDESQDVGFCAKDIFEKINIKKKMKVGDTYQSIFSFIGNANNMSEENLKGWDIAHLTKSFRTPKYLAKYSDNFLKVFRGEQETFKGAKEDNEIVRTKNDTYAIITRTNSGMIKYMMSLKEKKQKFKTVRHPNEIFSHVMDISNLANNQRDRVMNQSFLKLTDMLSDYNKEHPNSNKSLFGYILDELEDIDRDAYSAVNMINRYGMKELYEIRKLALSYYESEEPIRTFILTGHSAKGLEFDHCLVGDDFPNMFDIAYDIVAEQMNPALLTYEKYLKCLEKYDNSTLKLDELNLIYVSMTRAMKSLKIDGSNREYLTEYDQLELIDRIKEIHESKSNKSSDNTQFNYGAYINGY